MSSQAASATTAVAVVVPDDGGGMSVGDDAPVFPCPNRWFFDKDRLEHTPSRRCGIDADKELTYRQQSANFIQDIGQRLQVNQLCINTAIVYMHRFYMFHSFSQFHRNAVSTASIFLAAKVEEQPRKLEHVIKVAHYCLYRDTQPQIDVKSDQYLEQSSELVMNENILLQTLGFDVAIDHPHTHVVKCCQLVRASKDLAQTSYFMATNSLHLTTMCLQYKPTVVACVCIHLACKWSNWEIPRSKEGKDWFWYVDDTVTTEQLETLTTEFLTIFNKSPSRLKKKIISLNQASGGSNLSLNSYPAHLGLDPTSPGVPNFTKARPPSPAGSTKRPQQQKPSSSLSTAAKTSKIPHTMGAPHHPVKQHLLHQAGSANKHMHSASSKPPPVPGHPYILTHPSAKDAYNKDLHPPLNKDQHAQHSKEQHSQHNKDQHSQHKNPHAVHNPYGAVPPYGHSGRPSVSHSNAQGHHGQNQPSHSSQKAVPPSSHPAHPYSSSNPSQNPSKASHSINMSSSKPHVSAVSSSIKNSVHTSQIIKTGYSENRLSSRTAAGENANNITQFTATSSSDSSKKRRHPEGVADSRTGITNKRARSDGHSTVTVPPYSEDLSESKKSTAPKSPPHVSSRDSRGIKPDPMSMPTALIADIPEAITPFLELKGGDTKHLLPSLSLELQPPELIPPFSDPLLSSTLNKSHDDFPLSVPVRPSLFSPDISDISPPMNIPSFKNEYSHALPSFKPESLAGLNEPNSSKPFSSNSLFAAFDEACGLSIISSSGPAMLPQVSGSSALISPMVNSVANVDHHNKSKKKKKDKHKHKDKHKDKEDKKHKKDKHKDKDREKHKSKEKHRAPEPSEFLDSAGRRIKISFGPQSNSKDLKSKHSSSKKIHSEEVTPENQKISANLLGSFKSVTPGNLKVKILNKERVRSMDEDRTSKSGSSSSSRVDLHSMGQSTPCCPGFGPCTNPACPQHPQPNPASLKVKITKDKSKTAPAPQTRPKEKEPKKSKKDKEKKASICAPSITTGSSSGRSNASSSSHVHKNGVEKSSRKRDKTATAL